jgi:hypothetical protein
LVYAGYEIGKSRLGTVFCSRPAKYHHAQDNHVEPRTSQPNANGGSVVRNDDVKGFLFEFAGVHVQLRLDRRRPAGHPFRLIIIATDQSRVTRTKRAAVGESLTELTQAVD